MKYIGTIDTDGVEPLIEETRENLYPLIIRAEFNHSKKAVVFKIDLTENEYNELSELINERSLTDPIIALMEKKISLPKIEISTLKELLEYHNLDLEIETINTW